MKWAELTPEQRDVLVHTKVMGWAEDRVGAPGDTVFAWTRWEDGANLVRLEPSIPHYTTSMDAAWQVLQHIAARYNPKSRYDYEPFNRLTDDLLGDREEIYPSHDCMYGIVKWTPDRICLAALRAVGAEV